MSAPPVVLAVGGTDSGGAAGLAADLATIGHLGCHAACAVTAVTAQDTTGVHAVHQVPPAVLAAQLDAVLGDLPVSAVKTGMLGSPEAVRLVAESTRHLLLVVDPVLVATSGAVLGDDAVRRAYREDLLPFATVATPNLAEARALAASDTDASDLISRLADLGCAVVLTGGPEWRPGRAVATCTDWLCEPGGTPVPLRHPAVPTTADHGTGCTYASALAARLAHGAPLAAAAADAAAYVASRLATSSTWDLGRGRGPVAHLAPSTCHRIHQEETA
ncbi:phosphomethylpyrimidine kinase [Nocardioides sp. Root122]|uniref:bifunctional hydroxymethylpyrimidine kinase/phosphomethylpyrimidine kinase n=1 Tax=Nocardioides TaxID=1839 RepID=UPI00070373D7|nr:MULTISPECIES: bifunctional hydroxymethylpyrimidine kinase/phosphomethylpyrimidine kinase [Nocardioides]KQV69694.1 phosphomethylpyrimidine kinase [Nocardioides sp. Root122]MCK9824641.1 bifunctional hydroxymethylpyrimidine kinase/phosphomethylpyrimidine kinase [Nocardioides cavernae]